MINAIYVSVCPYTLSSSNCSSFPLSHSQNILFSQLPVLTYIVQDDFCSISLPGCWARCSPAKPRALTNSSPHGWGRSWVLPRCGAPVEGKRFT